MPAARLTPEGSATISHLAREEDFMEWEGEEIPVEGARLEVAQLLLVETSGLLLLHPPHLLHPCSLRPGAT